MDKINILVKYGELTLKKKNSGMFKSVLQNNIENALQGLDFEINLSYSRLYIEIFEKDLDIVILKLKRIYGIHSFAVYVKCDNDIEIIKQVSASHVSKSYRTFKVQTKRKNKRFAIPSMEISRQVGGYIRAYCGLEVDLINPELVINIEVRNKMTLIYYDEYKGLSGLPVSVSGKGLLLLSGGIDSPVAGYMINKRGVKFDAIHFYSPPYTAKESLDKVIDLCDKLVNYNNNFNLYVVKFTKVQEALLQLPKESYMITIMRRIMYIVASRLATKENHKILISGDAIGQVASQTLSSMNTVNDVCKHPVIRPLSIFDKSETIQIARKIDTYDISIRNFEDCCTVFVPSNPVINPTIVECEKLEANLDIASLVDYCLENMEIIKITSNKKKFSELL